MRKPRRLFNSGKVRPVVISNLILYHDDRTRTETRGRLLLLFRDKSSEYLIIVVAPDVVVTVVVAPDVVVAVVVVPDVVVAAVVVPADVVVYLLVLFTCEMLSLSSLMLKENFEKVAQSGNSNS